MKMIIMVCEEKEKMDEKKKHKKIGRSVGDLHNHCVYGLQ